MLVGGATGGGFETLRGDKTHCFISINPKLTIIQKTHNTHPLFLSNVSHNSLHTNKHKLGTLFIHEIRIQKFKLSKCEGGC